jgi:hypothetical protein
MRPIYIPLAGLAMMSLGFSLLQAAQTTAMADLGYWIGKLGIEVALFGGAYVLGRVDGAREAKEKKTP